MPEEPGRSPLQPIGGRLQDELEAQFAALGAADGLSVGRAALIRELESTRERLEALRDALASAASSPRHSPRSAPAETGPAPVVARRAVGTREEDGHPQPQRDADRLLAAIRTMDAARSLSGVLAALVDTAALEGTRLVLFVENGKDLQGWKAVGFDEPIRSLQVGTGDEGLLAEGVRRREPVVIRQGDGSGLAPPPFAALPSGCTAMAVPLLVGSEPVALLYVDDGGGAPAGTPASWREVIQILGRHASADLAHLTAARTAEVLRRAWSLPGGPA